MNTPAWHTKFIPGIPSLTKKRLIPDGFSSVTRTPKYISSPVIPPLTSSCGTWNLRRPFPLWMKLSRRAAVTARFPILPGRFSSVGAIPGKPVKSSWRKQKNVAHHWSVRSYNKSGTAPSSSTGRRSKSSRAMCPRMSITLLRKSSGSRRSRSPSTRFLRSP